VVRAFRNAGTGQRGVDEGADLLGGIVEDLRVELAGGAGGFNISCRKPLLAIQVCSLLGKSNRGN
jgi:hypothetical protein